MDKLIAAVQARECLWDKSYRGHRNRFKLERYWNEVAAEVGTTSKTPSYILFGEFVSERAYVAAIFVLAMLVLSLGWA